MNQQRDNSGTLGENRRKESDKHPDMTGSIRIDGKDYWLSGWWKKGQSEFLSLAVKPKTQTQRPATDDSERPF